MRAFYRFTCCLLVTACLVAVWGAFVRASGSGAGCGSHWPLCNGEVLPPSPALETIIELTHRITSAIYGLMVLALVAWTWRQFPKRHGARKTALVILLLTLVEVLLGAGLVRFGLVADNASIERGFAMAAHLMTTFALIGALVLMVAHAAGWAPFRSRERAHTRWLAAALFATLLVGISGAIAALGDTLYPVASMIEGLRQDLSPSAGLLVRLRILHPFFAIGAAALLLQVAIRESSGSGSSPSKRVRVLGRTLIGLVLVELVAGGTNVLLAAPISLQLVHLALAYSLWIVLCLLSLAHWGENDQQQVNENGTAQAQGSSTE